MKEHDMKSVAELRTDDDDNIDDNDNDNVDDDNFHDNYDDIDMKMIMILMITIMKSGARQKVSCQIVRVPTINMMNIVTILRALF